MSARRILDLAARRWVPVVLVALAILVGSVLPVPGALGRPVGPVGLDSWLHALAFACLAAAAVLAIEPASRDRLSDLLVVAVAVIGYGIAIELLQLALPYRRFAVADIAADTAGVLIVVVGWWLRRRNI